MNAVEIEEAVSDLAGAPFDPVTFPYAFLTAFGVKETTIARLRKGDTNASDVGGVLQRGNIHIAVAVPGGVNDVLRALRESPKTAAAKAKFILATDGQTLEAEDLVSGEPLACAYHEFADHFGFFLPLAGISTVKELKNNPIDVKATGRLNRLYVELLKENAEWGTPERRHDLNQFMARLIFCFFAEDTGIFNGTNLFTSTLERMTTTEAGSVEHVLTELFRAMDIAPEKRQDAKLRSWADAFPYVNGGLFAGGKPCPQFSKIARSYLLRAGELNWREINPDIFGSMIQAVADEGERGSLGMHYTSVPNIMKVLGPLFLDDLHAQLEAAGDNVRKLRNLRKRLANIRVFDPACGSGNFLVIAYIRMREVEHEIVKLTGDPPRSVIPLSNFYGIEIKDFAAEIARLALLIAEFQCDVRFIDQHIARSLVLPLKRTGQIKTGNALREDWLAVCPPISITYEEHDLGGSTGRLALDGDQKSSEEGETYICGNPPYKGSQGQSNAQKEDLRIALARSRISSGSVDYVLGWFWKAAEFGQLANADFAFVTTNSVNQGRQVGAVWPDLLADHMEIFFAEPSFKWSNLASNKAVVTVSVVGISTKGKRSKIVFDKGLARQCSVIGPYLIPDQTAIIDERRSVLSDLPQMLFGSMPNDGGSLIMSASERRSFVKEDPSCEDLVKPMYGSNELSKGLIRYCIWIPNCYESRAKASKFIVGRVEMCRQIRSDSTRAATNSLSSVPFRFGEVRQRGDEKSIIIAKTSSDTRDYLPVGVLPSGSIITEAFGIFDAPNWSLAVIASKMHIAWIKTVCGKMKTDPRYSNTLGWNTFPLPVLTEQNKTDLSKCAENIILAREAHFPKSIAELYDPDEMPDNLRQAHEINDDIVERIYIGRRFRNDTERLEKLFELYTRMTAAETRIVTAKKPGNRGRSRAAAGAV